jgi:type IV secretory pathway VirB4 component
MKPLLVGYDAKKQPVLLDCDDAKAHTHLIGSSGSGKSKLMPSLMRESLKNRQGFRLVDPHGSLYHDMVGLLRPPCT